MSTTQEYIAEIQKLEKPGLIQLWEGILDRNTPGWGNGKAFEFLILRAFELEGASVRWPYEVELFGETVEQIDGVIHLEDIGLSVLVECKDHASNINFDSIAKVRNQLLRRPGNIIGAVFSVNGFTEPALTLARFVFPQTIILWEKDDIEQCLNKTSFIDGIVLKYKHAIEEGFPNFDIKKAVQ